MLRSLSGDGFALLTFHRGGLPHRRSHGGGGHGRAGGCVRRVRRQAPRLCRHAPSRSRRTAGPGRRTTGPAGRPGREAGAPGAAAAVPLLHGARGVRATRQAVGGREAGATGGGHAAGPALRHGHHDEHRPPGDLRPGLPSLAVPPGGRGDLGPHRQRDLRRPDRRTRAARTLPRPARGAGPAGAVAPGRCARQPARRADGLPGRGCGRRPARAALRDQPCCPRGETPLAPAQATAGGQVGARCRVGSLVCGRGPQPAPRGRR